MHINRLHIILFSIVSILLFGGVQKVEGQIVLRDAKLNFTPHEFYVADVTDDRPNKSPAASLIFKDEAHGYVTRAGDLKDGVPIAIRHFIGNNLQQDTSLRPVIISIKALKLTETSQPGGRIGGHLAIDLAFGLQKNYGSLALTEYTAGIRYARSDAVANMAEPTIRQGIEQGLIWFNKWMNDHAETDARLARSVKVSLTDFSEKTEGDTIYYSVGRPLTWPDFREKPMAGNFDAEIFTSVGYTEQASVVHGVIHLNISIKVELAKSDCWVRSRAQDDYALNHEQRHFDIDKIIGEHFKQKLLAMNLPPDNYDGDINMEYLETLRELHRMQTQYDRETRHGRDGYAQSQWDKKIDAELEALNVKK
ncbi:MAG: hypothetical protein JSU01_06870 [Bacteroidetes bacterium]|nr:hypothetical protein [Bacteroidota bacterium]